MQQQEVETTSMNEAYRTWRESVSYSFLEKVPDSLLHYMFCVGWHEREVSDLYEKDIIKQINQLFK
jgi:hypothetical protein